MISIITSASSNLPCLLYKKIGPNIYYRKTGLNVESGSCNFFFFFFFFLITNAKPSFFSVPTKTCKQATFKKWMRVPESINCYHTNLLIIWWTLDVPTSFITSIPSISWHGNSWWIPEHLEHLKVKFAKPSVSLKPPMICLKTNPNNRHIFVQLGSCNDMLKVSK